MTYCDEIPELSESVSEALGHPDIVAAVGEGGKIKLFKGIGVSTRTPSFPIETTAITDFRSHATVSYTGSTCCSWISDGTITEFCR